MNAFVIGQSGVIKDLPVSKKKNEILYLRLFQSKGGPEDIFIDRDRMPHIENGKIVGDVSIYRSKISNRWLLGKRKNENTPTAVILVQNVRDVNTYPFPLQKIPAGGKCGDFLIEVNIGTRVTVIFKEGNQAVFEFTGKELIDTSKQRMNHACRMVE